MGGWWEGPLRGGGKRDWERQEFRNHMRLCRNFCKDCLIVHMFLAQFEREASKRAVGREQIEAVRAEL